MNGPVPTGWVLVKFAGFETVDQMCLGTIGVCAIVAANGTSGALKVMVTSLPAAETAVTCDQIPLLSSAGYFFSRSNVNTTSAGVSGVPSLHFTPGRIVYTSVVGLGELVPGGQERRVAAVDRADRLQRL